MPKKKAWAAWEDDVADRTGGELVKASGMTDMYKGDVKTASFLIDAKETFTDGYAVTDGFWSKLATWARNEGREPAIAIRIEDPVNDPFEIAVVSEIWYSEHHPGFEPDGQLKKKKQRKLTRCAAGGKPTSFMVGKYRLVAYSFDEWVGDMNED